MYNKKAVDPNSIDLNKLTDDFERVEYGYLIYKINLYVQALRVFI